MSSGRKAAARPVIPAKTGRPARASASQRVTHRVMFSRAAPLRSVSDTDPFMRVKRPFN